jgi:hypothetical protein
LRYDGTTRTVLCDDDYRYNRHDRREAALYVRAAALFLGRSCASISWGGESAAFSRPWLELVRTDVGRGTYNNEAGSVERYACVRESWRDNHFSPRSRLVAAHSLRPA